MNSSFGKKHVESGDEDGDSQVSENEKENAATNVLNKGKTPFVVKWGFLSNTFIYFWPFRTGQYRYQEAFF